MAYLNKLAEDRVSLTIPLDPNDPENKAHIVYRPNGYTGATEAAMRDADPQREPSRIMRQAVVALVESWDVKWNEDDEAPIPLDVDDLMDVPTVVLGNIVDRIGKDIGTRTPKHRTSKRSNTH